MKAVVGDVVLVKFDMRGRPFYVTGKIISQNNASITVASAWGDNNMSYQYVSGVQRHRIKELTILDKGE